MNLNLFISFQSHGSGMKADWLISLQDDFFSCKYSTVFKYSSSSMFLCHVTWPFGRVSVDNLISVSTVCAVSCFHDACHETAACHH